MSDYNSDGSEDTLSVGYAFDLPQFNLRGLRIFIGNRRRSSIAIDPMDDRPEWKLDDEGNADNRERGSLSFDRGFTGPRHPVSQHLGPAIDLALRMMETPKSIKIMTMVAKRILDDRPREVLHITPRSTAREVQALVTNWLAKLRQQEFFKIQLVSELGGCNSGVTHRYWQRYRLDTPATLASYYPHNAGMLQIDVKIVEKLVYHAFSRHAHPQSPIEHQICLFHVANLIINQVQTFWVAFLWPEMACNGNEQPVAVHNGATTGLLDYYRSPSAGYHWDAEFFGGTVLVQHRTDSPRAEFDAGGRFGRNLSIGYPYLNRADGTEQMVQMDSITRCLNHNFSEVLSGGLRTCGARVAAFGFPFLDYPGRG